MLSQIKKITGFEDWEETKYFGAPDYVRTVEQIAGVRALLLLKRTSLEGFVVLRREEVITPRLEQSGFLGYMQSQTLTTRLVTTFMARSQELWVLSAISDLMTTTAVLR